MGHETLHNQALDGYIKHITLRDNMTPPTTFDIAQACMQLLNDIDMYQKIQDTCYLNPQTHLPKDDSLYMAWEYANDPVHHYFVQMLCVF
jgi:hypothetical protein